MSESKENVETSFFGLSTPIQMVLVCFLIILVYKLFKRVFYQSIPPQPQAMRKRDFTIDELKKYNGTQEDGRVLVAINGNVYDVTKGGFYDRGKYLLIIFLLRKNKI